LAPLIDYQGSTTGDYPSDYFSNEHVGAPQLMDQDGIFFTIVMTQDTGGRCLNHNLDGAAIDRQHAIFLDGTTATLNVFTFPRTTEPFMVLNTLHNGRCYQFDVITLNVTVRDSNETTVIDMLRSFRFTTAPSPTP